MIWGDFHRDIFFMTDFAHYQKVHPDFHDVSKFSIYKEMPCFFLTAPSNAKLVQHLVLLTFWTYIQRWSVLG